jgi:hypothetical protein
LHLEKAEAETELGLQQACYCANAYHPFKLYNVLLDTQSALSLEDWMWSKTTLHATQNVANQTGIRWSWSGWAPQKPS